MAVSALGHLTALAQINPLAGEIIRRCPKRVRRSDIRNGIVKGHDAHHQGLCRRSEATITEDEASAGAVVRNTSGKSNDKPPARSAPAAQWAAR